MYWMGFFQQIKQPDDAGGLHLAPRVPLSSCTRLKMALQIAEGEVLAVSLLFVMVIIIMIMIFYFFFFFFFSFFITIFSFFFSFLFFVILFFFFSLFLFFFSSFFSFLSSSLLLIWVSWCCSHQCTANWPSTQSNATLCCHAIHGDQGWSICTPSRTLSYTGISRPRTSLWAFPLMAAAGSSRRSTQSRLRTLACRNSPCRRC